MPKEGILILTGRTNSVFIVNFDEDTKNDCQLFIFKMVFGTTQTSEESHIRTQKRVYHREAIFMAFDCCGGCKVALDGDLSKYSWNMWHPEKVAWLG